MKVLSLLTVLLVLISCGRDSDVSYSDPGYTTPSPTTVVYAPAGHHHGPGCGHSGYGHGGGRRWPTPPRWGGHRPGGHGPRPGGGHGGGHGGPGGGHHLMPEAIITDKICDQYTDEAYTNCLEGFKNSESN